MCFLHCLITTTAFSLSTLLSSAPEISTNNPREIDRSIGKEPRYESIPKYSLLTLGDNGGDRVWMVEDGKRLFVDKNANGDLTDDGPPAVLSNIRTLSPGSWDAKYAVGSIRQTNGSVHTNFVLHKWNYNDKEDEYGLSLTVHCDMPIYAGWFGTFWSTNRSQAPVIHFGGPFTPKLLRRKDFLLGEKGERLSLCFFNPGSGPGATSRLSIDALPSFIIPKLHIEWPVEDGHPPVRSSHSLIQRCCYWEFYTTEFEVPKDAAPGTAKITIDLPPAASEIHLTTNQLTASVVRVR